MPSVSGVSPNAVSLPKGGGDVKGLGSQFVPNYNRGTGSYQLDLNLPAGPAGISPNLSLSYSSAGSNGPFGLGWTINVAAIHRDGERSFLTYDDDDTFSLGEQGQLVRLSGDRYRPRHDQLFAEIVRGDGWEVRLRDGSIQRFGMDPESRLSHPSRPDDVLAWCLSEIVDRNGNSVRYRYTRLQNNLYLSEVAYSIYRVVFDYEGRPDAFGTARYGFPIETAMRCNAIELHCERLQGHTLIRRYDLAYTWPASVENASVPAGETPLSLLQRVTLTGERLVDGVVRSESLPPLTFEYSRVDIGGGRLSHFESQSEFALPPLGIDGTELLDFSGDGLPDIVQMDGTRNRVWNNLGGGLWGPPTRIRPIPAGVRIGAPNTTFADLSGNGAPDLFVAAGARAGYFPNLGKGNWGRFVSYRDAPEFSLTDPNTRQLDLDADGRIDLLRTAENSFYLYLGDGPDGWKPPVVISRIRDRALFPDIFLADPDVFLADMTGDGLTDIVLIRPGEICYWPYENLGRWGARRTMEAPPAFPRSGVPRRVFLSDVNGDGLADVVVVEDDAVTVWINQGGRRFAAPCRLDLTPSSVGAEVRLVDMLGKGTAGVLWSYQSQAVLRRPYLYLDLGSEQKPHLLTGVDNGLGKRTTITYQSSSSFAARDRCDGRPWETFLPIPVQVVSEIRQADALHETESRSEIRYHDGVYDGLERRFAGFGRVELIEHGDDDETTLVTAMTFDRSATEDLDRDGRIRSMARWGKLLETTQSDLHGTMLRRSAAVWIDSIAEHGLDRTPVVVVHRTENIVEVPGGDGASLVVSHRFDFDACGNIIRDRYEANGEQPLSRITEVSYARLQDGSTLSLPCAIVERTADGRIFSEQRIYYDGEPFVGLTLGLVEKGNVTRQSMRVMSIDEFAQHYDPAGLNAIELGYRVEDEAVWADTARCRYNDRGNVIASRSPMGHDTTTAHDAEELFAVEVRNPAGHPIVMSWDDAALQPSELRGPNGEITRFAFDALGRVVALASPGNDLSDPSETVAYHLGSLPPFVDLAQKMSDVPARRSHRRTFCDGSGRDLQVRTRVDDEKVVVSAAIMRNGRGWQTGKGDPTFSNAMDYAGPASTPIARVQYDPLGRAIRTIHPNGKFSKVVYETFRTLIFDANDTDEARDGFNTPVIQRLDGWGRITGLTEVHDGLITSHRYNWDSSGRLLEVFGPSGSRMLRQSYDLIGNRLVVEHRDAGKRKYFYDAAAKLVLTIDAEDHRVATDYDVLDRAVSTSVDGSIVHRFRYDVPGVAMSLGRLVEASDMAGNWSLSYDESGRVTERKLSADEKSWAFGFRYHANGQLAAAVYPDGTETGYRYDLAAKLIEIPGVVDEIRWDASGRRVGLRYANKVETFFEYDDLTKFLDRIKVVSASGRTLRDDRYKRDNVGNVLAIEDWREAPAASVSATSFRMDGRYRLIEASQTSPLSVSERYRYDKASNFTSFPTFAEATLTYDPPDSNRIAGVSTGGSKQVLFRHDANGNLVGLPDRTLQFDPLGRLTGARASDGRQTDYRYSASGERVWRRSVVNGRSSQTLSLAGLYEQDDDGSVRRFVGEAGGKFMIESATERVFLHSNDLGHVTLFTNAAGEEIGRREFLPFGASGASSGAPGLLGFGGKEFDDVSGLYGFGARYFAPELGRFVSPDPYYLAYPQRGLSSPQLLNLYAYANNNPMFYADPTGLSLLGAAFGGLLGGVAGGAIFVLTGGNAIAAGLVGGLIGGAVSGAIDGGARGAVIGGLIGTLAGGVGGGAFWGISALAGHLGGWVVQDTLAQIVPAAVSTSYLLGVGVPKALSNNWDSLASFALGMAGSVIGARLVNTIIMGEVYGNINSSPRVRSFHDQIQSKIGSRADLHFVDYRIDASSASPLLGYHESSGDIAFVRPNIGDDYVQFRTTQAHEIAHEIQQQELARGIISQRDWDSAWATFKQDMVKNPYQYQAEQFARMATNFVPEQTYFLRLSWPTLLTVSNPTVYDDRRSNFWKDSD